MTTRELLQHYTFCLIGAIAVGAYIGHIGTYIGCFAGFLTFAALSAIQVHEADHRRRPHKQDKP